MLENNTLHLTAKDVGKADEITTRHVTCSREHSTACTAVPCYHHASHCVDSAGENLGSVSVLHRIIQDNKSNGTLIYTNLKKKKQCISKGFNLQLYMAN